MIAHLNTDFGSPISSRLVCNTIDSIGQRYIIEREIINQTAKLLLTAISGILKSSTNFT